MAAALDEVHLRSDGLALHRSLRSDRQVSHYRPALRWAGWILQLLSPDLRSGSGSAPELLFDMNRVFELAVTARLKRRANALGLRLHSQHSGRHLAYDAADPHRHFFGLRPDLVLSQGKKILAVADTKWSRLATDNRGYLVPTDAHAYQLNAYAGAYPCNEAILIYPWHQTLGNARISGYRLPDSGDRQPVLHVVCADVEHEDLPLRLVDQRLHFAGLAC